MAWARLFLAKGRASVLQPQGAELGSLGVNSQLRRMDRSDQCSQPQGPWGYKQKLRIHFLKTRLKKSEPLPLGTNSWSYRKTRGGTLANWAAPEGNTRLQDGSGLPALGGAGVQQQGKVLRQQLIPTAAQVTPWSLRDIAVAWADLSRAPGAAQAKTPEPPLCGEEALPCPASSDPFRQHLLDVLKA